MTTLLVSWLVLMLYMSGLFVLSLRLKNNAIADVGYGIAFVALITTQVLLVGFPHVASLVLVLLVYVWAVRLARRIHEKNKGKPEDFRYKAWRESWGKSFVVRSYFQIYVLQGCVAFVVALPVSLSIVFPRTEISWVPVLLGVFLWLVGFVHEAVADAQLDAFLKKPEHKGKIMQQGLWRFSRHPNYFGESLMWWSLALAACGLTTYPLIAFVSPLLITFLLLKVSGVPMLEKRWEGNPEWEAYKAKTSVFIPLPPKE